MSVVPVANSPIPRTAPRTSGCSWVQNSLQAAIRKASETVASTHILPSNWRWSALPMPRVPAAIASTWTTLRFGIALFTTKVILPDGTTDKSFCFSFTGKGKMVFPEWVREGDFVNGLLHGKGKWTYSDGKVLEGDFVNGRLHGKGKWTYKHGSPTQEDEGDFVNDKLHGKAKRTCRDGTFYNVEFFNDRIKTNASHLGTFTFLKYLNGISTFGASPLFVLGIMSDYLIKKGYLALGRNLESATSFAVLPEGEIRSAAQTILDNLRKGTSQLLDYGYKAHSTLLNITHDPSSEFVFFEIFNSGNGLKFHEMHPIQNKFQTKLLIKAPLKNLTLRKIEQFLNCNGFRDISSSYETITSIPGAEIVKSNPETAIWQADQKFSNCAIKAPFVYLRHQMSKDDYDRMRIEFFRDCIVAGHQENPGHPDMQQIEEILDKKIAKREARLNGGFKE